MSHIMITGGAGYIGSLLTATLLAHGDSVTVVDDLLFGGESLLAFWHNPLFRFVKGDACDPDVLNRALRDGADAVVHLAAIVGFPACQAVGERVAWRYNVTSTQTAFTAAENATVPRFIFSSTYSNYGLSPDGLPVTEQSPLNPQSLYAETKIAAEKWLAEKAGESLTAPVIFRFATLFGVSPRTRFDLIVNQFVLEAITKRELVIYQRGYSRSFVHVRDIAAGILLALHASEDVVRGQIFNLGSDDGNYTKDEIVQLVAKHLPGLQVTHKDLSFGGDMRDITVSFAKVKRDLAFEPTLTVEQGIVEVRDALRLGVIKDATDTRFRNAQFIVQ